MDEQDAVAVEFRQEPVIWAARIAGGRVAEWRLYPDQPEVRRQLGLPPASEG